jgi:hypothetical protein
VSSTIHLGFRDLCVRVESADANQLGWLEEFLAPALVRCDAATADCVVTVREDADELARLRARAGGGDVALADCLILDGGPVRLPAWRDGDDRIVLHDDARVAYRVSADRRRIDLVSASRNPGGRTALMKLVRELAMSAAWAPRGVLLHAAACVVDTRAVLIAGPREAGKTSLLLHALGAPGARLLANDRVVLDLAGDAPVAHGMPVIVSLRLDTVARAFPDRAALGAALRYRFQLTVKEAECRAPETDPAPRRLTCSPAQLGRLLGVELVGRATAAVLLLPRVDAATKGIALRRIDAAEARTRGRDVRFAAHAAPQVSEVFAIGADAGAPSAAEVGERWSAAVEGLRVFDCRLGPDAYDEDPAQLFAAVLEK